MHGSIKFANNADTFTTESITAESTIIPVIEKSTPVFPKIDKTKDQYFYLMIVDPVNQSKYEYVKCIDLTDTTFTVERGKDGTVAQSFQKDSRVIHTLNAGGIYDAQDQSRLVRSHAETDSVYGSGTAQEYGHVKLTDDFELGTQAVNGIACTPQALHKAVARLTALPKEQLFTTSTPWVCPESGTYTITCVGGGGQGGTGGYGTKGFCSCSSPDGYCRPYISGAGGGGGGAGQTTAKAVQCTKDFMYDITVGGPAGRTIFGNDIVVGLPGGTGGTGGNGLIPTGCSPQYGSGGSVGVNYGTGGSSGQRSNYIYSTGCTPAVPASQGGVGATSIFGSGFGSGGHGGAGRTNVQECKDNQQGPYGGTTGTQGCVKITYPLSK